MTQAETFKDKVKFYSQSWLPSSLSEVSSDVFQELVATSDQMKDTVTSSLLVDSSGVNTDV